MTVIYLSSTYEDLKEHRLAVFNALRKGGYTVVAMEDYVAADQRPLARCLADVESADVYVGLVAFRYGYIPPQDDDNPQGVSITELEYRRATALHKPCLIYVAQETTPWPPVFVDAFSADDEGARIKRFRRHLLDAHLTSSFTAPHELASLVLAAIAKHLATTKTQTTLPSLESSIAVHRRWDTGTLGSPFPGLNHFTRRHAPVYFGRDADVRSVLDRLDGPGGRFMVVSGDSGSGKSSMVHAGVLPQLGRSALRGFAECAVARVVPSQGGDAFDALARSLAPHIEDVELGTLLAEEWQKSPATLATSLTELFPTDLGLGQKRAVVLFIDQLEELFIGAHSDESPHTASSFLSALHHAYCEVPWLWVIATLRSDFLHHCHRHPALLEVLRGPGHYPLGRAEPYMLRDMIALPAQCAGLALSEKLLRQLVRDAGSEPGNLPLLAFVLQRLYEERGDDAMDESAYARIGGVAGAIAGRVRAAEVELQKRFGNAGLACLPEMFKRLVTINLDGIPTRRRALSDSFQGTMRGVLDYFVQQRLLSTEGEGAGSTVSVAHERVFTAWPTLAQWIAENRDDLRMLRQAETDAAEWIGSGHAPAYLWHPGRIKRLEEALERLGQPETTLAVRDFLRPQRALVDLLDQANLTHIERAVIGVQLATLSDTRAGVGLREDGAPDIEWMPIPEGLLKMEGARARFQVERFYMSRYPITNLQFQAFVDAPDGYGNDDWWKRLKRIGTLRRTSANEANFPRTDVSWYDAVAFTRWLSYRLGQDIRLPTEWQWQQAATGGKATSIYPWAKSWSPDRCNGKHAEFERCISVGLYPAGSSLHGVFDMSGNIHEWCINRYESPKLSVAVIVDLSDDFRATRGGSWASSPEELRTKSRDRRKPLTRLDSIGFRVCRAHSG